MAKEEDPAGSGEAEVGSGLEPATPELLSPPPQTPRTRRHPPPSFARSLSTDPGVGMAVQRGPSEQEQDLSRWQLLLQRIHDPGAYLKMAHLALSVMCLGFVSDGYLLVVGLNVAAMHFPFIVFSSNIIITSVMLFGYVAGMKMRELLMRIFGVMSGLLLLISAIHTANHAYVYWKHWKGMYEEGATDENPIDEESIPRRTASFVMQAALAFCAAALQLADVATSCRRTLALMQ